MPFFRPLRTLVSLVALGLTPLCVFAAAPKLKPSDHLHTERQCTRCHTDGVDISGILQSGGKDCMGCHSQAETQTKLAALVHPPTVPAAAPLAKPALATNSGMRYPLYYPNTRLGDAPNEMVLIPAGEFIMGSNERLPDEGPQHTVYLPAYFIDKYEVTNLQYKKFNDATNGKSPGYWRNRTFPEGKVDHPVVYVTWQDAKAYCNWAGKRLPTDAEWEKAARGTDGRWFPWGNQFDAAKANTPLRWKEIGVFGDTTPVGSFDAGLSPYGVYDMSGNVWEWTDSWYKAYPNNKTPSESYGERYKTLKGGSWFDCSFYNCGISAPVFNRSFFAVKTQNDSFGFRCAKDAPRKGE